MFLKRKVYRSNDPLSKAASSQVTARYTAIEHSREVSREVLPGNPDFNPVFHLV